MRKRAGLLLIASGLALAGLAVVLVMGIARQATEASHAQVRQVDVVTARRDIAQDSLVTADALDVKTFPADFAPAGAVSSLDDVVGKYSRGFIPTGQIVVAGQLESALPTPNLSDRITPGMVVMWLPMPDVLVNQNIMHPGDRVDILLTAPVRSTDGSTDKSADGLSTQTTLQDVLVYRVGNDEFDQPFASASAQSTPTQGSSTSLTGSSSSKSAANNGPRTIGFLVDHQDAVTMKFVKDAGGTIDLVMRSQGDQQVVRTDGVTLDSLADRFHFRVPQPVHADTTPKQSA
jgi:pilus assembly protein CpaB